MKRRHFVKTGLGLAIVAQHPGFPEALVPGPAEDFPGWLTALVRQNDQRIDALKSYQNLTEQDPDYGGVRDGQEIYNPHSTSALIQVAACGLSSPGSGYYRSAALMHQVRLAAGYLLRTQHEDGTIDLLSTNFHSTPDTAFLVKRLANAYVLISKPGIKDAGPVLEALKSFLVRGGKALREGGIHTPNHRWVVCAALTRLNALWPDPLYTARIEQWLAEGIDMDPDGQYNERSTFIYSSLSDRVLITIANGTGKTQLLDYVRRNLDMTQYYVHPNGEVVTDASGRQDKALAGTLENYYYPYRYLALRDRNPLYAAMCRLIEKTAGDKIIAYLDYYLTDPFLWSGLPEAGTLPESYVKTFPYSGLVRIREGNWDSTLIARNPAWFTFMKGQAAIQGIRLASSFFGKGQFQSAEITETENGWKLTQRLEGPYFQPLPSNRLPGDGDWAKMPRTERPQSEVQILETTILIRKHADGMEIEVSTSGTARVPLALEIIFRPGGELYGVSPAGHVRNSWILKEGTGRYVYGNDTITFGPGSGMHANTSLRGALPHTDAPTVYLTGFTPFKHVLKIS